MSKIKRLLNIAYAGLLPTMKAKRFDPSGEKIDIAGGSGWEYPCFSCGEPSKHGGYQPCETRKKYDGHRQSLCKSCKARRRKWTWKHWLDTGERVKVPEVDGEGYISPSTTRGYRIFPVYSLFGFEFTLAVAARSGRKNSLNARYWFRKMRVEGNSEGVKRAVNANTKERA